MMLKRLFADTQNSGDSGDPKPKIRRVDNNTEFHGATSSGGPSILPGGSLNVNSIPLQHNSGTIVSPPPLLPSAQKTPFPLVGSKSGKELPITSLFPSPSSSPAPSALTFTMVTPPKTSPPKPSSSTSGKSSTKSSKEKDKDKEKVKRHRSKTKSVDVKKDRDAMPAPPKWEVDAESVIKVSHKKKHKVSREEKKFWKEWKRQQQAEFADDEQENDKEKEEKHNDQDYVEMRNFLYSRQSGYRIQQDFLNLVIQLRKSQGLPPFFAMITGPTITPYRMEALSVTLGRNTSLMNAADIHIGDSRRVSHQHAKIEFNREHSYYCLINLSKNGLKIKKGDRWLECREVNASIPLPNPSVFKIDEQVFYFQIFYIRSSDPKTGATTAVSKTQAITIPGGAAAGKEVATGTASTAKKAESKSVRSYAEMIEAALLAHNGAATYKDITKWISTNLPDDVAERRTWRKSVGGVLSSHVLFELIPNSEEGEKRSRGGVWRLRSREEVTQLKLQQHNEKAQAATTQSTPKSSSGGTGLPITSLLSTSPSELDASMPTSGIQVASMLEDEPDSEDSAPDIIPSGSIPNEDEEIEVV